MPLLRLSNGRVYTTVEDINPLIAPLQVGKFNISKEVAAKVAGFTHPISQADAVYLLENFDPEARAMVEAEGFTYRRVGNVVPSRENEGHFDFNTRHAASAPDAKPIARTPEEIEAYLTPHYVQVNDWHFVYSGGIVKGVQLEGDLQGIVYCQAGDWVRLNPTILNWPVFPFGQGTAAVSCFDRPFDTPFQMDLHPEVAVKPEMRY